MSLDDAVAVYLDLIHKLNPGDTDYWRFVAATDVLSRHSEAHTLPKNQPIVKLARMWTLATDPRPGNSGKIPALQFLNKVGKPFTGISIPGAYLEGINLENAKLMGAKLDKANLSSATLWNANLWNTNLQDADLSSADLQYADLTSADLRNATLPNAKLQNADLRSAELQNADLRGADLRGADLRNADLRGANLQNTDLKGADLRVVRNLNCTDLGSAVNWNEVVRDEGLACDNSIPEPPE